MASSPGSDSDFSIEFFSLEGSGELSSLSISGNLPTLDLQSTDPLPTDSEGATKTPSAAAESTSSKQLSAQNTGGATGSRPRPRKKGDIWLDGDVVFCGCPDCGAPVAIRIWLMMADCWRCSTCIELSEEQERQVKELLRQREQQSTAAAPKQHAETNRQPQPAAPAPPPTPSRDRRSLPVARPPSTETRFKPSPSVPRPATGSRRPSAAQARLRQRMKRKASDAWITEFFNGIPAFVVSMIFHIILLLLLALIPTGREVEEQMTLSLAIGPKTEGERKAETDPLAELAFDLPVPENMDPEEDEVKRARDDAQDLLVEPGTDDPALPDLDSVRKLVRSQSPQRMIAGRDPRLRVEVLKREGGTVRTEAAVARGLRWIAQQQRGDGSWRLTGYPSPGKVRSPSAATSLALLPFLGAGQTHQSGKYRQQVAGGLQWLIKHQQKNGFLGYGSSGDSAMYSHGQATIVLCEAFSMTGDEQLRKPAQKAIDYIIKAQHRDGGWRYRPGMAGDTSVLGWQLMALHSGRVALLNVPDEAFDLADKYLDSVQYYDGALYAYNPQRRAQYLQKMQRSSSGSTPIAETMTAEALLCRMYLGWDKGRPELREGLDVLSKHFPANDSNYNIYYLYYATQAYRHFGGQPWRNWNLQMRELLINRQETRADLAGSWTPEAYFDQRGGRLFMTAMAVCCLEVYYRYLPVFQPE